MLRFARNDADNISTHNAVVPREGVGQSHMVFTRLVGWLASPLPLAGEADALEGAAGGGSLHTENPDAEAPPPPTLPRKRERERSADVAAPWASYAIALREGGGSSTPRLIGSITAVSGILGHPHARVTTTECAVAISRHDVPELCLNLVPRTEGAGNAGCLLHPRSRVQ
jgi:hypothetical protein